MSHATPIITPILATPFGVIALPRAAAANAQLEALATPRIAATAAPGSDPLYLRGSDDLFSWQEPVIEVLRSAMLEGVYAVLAACNEMSDAQLRALHLEARAWMSILKTDGSMPAGSYPLCAWCALYCVAAPVATGSRADSGVLRMYESRLGTMFQDASNAQLRFPFKTAHYSWRPVPGEMAVFPASLLHEIAPLRAPGHMSWVTARVRFVASGQEGLSRW